MNLDAVVRQKASPEWYTPPFVFKALACHFDLDPAHPVQPLPWVPAHKTYSIRDDGLHQPWQGRVWLNPPYGPHTPKWIGKLLHHGDGIALTFARTGSRWGQTGLAGAALVCFMQPRIRFWLDRDGREVGSPSVDTMLLAVGAECAAIVRRANLGVCMAVA